MRAGWRVEKGHGSALPTRCDTPIAGGYAPSGYYASAMFYMNKECPPSPRPVREQEGADMSLCPLAECNKYIEDICRPMPVECV